jgi:hypothetical protein
MASPKVKTKAYKRKTAGTDAGPETSNNEFENEDQQALDIQATLPRGKKRSSWIDFSSPTATNEKLAFLNPLNDLQARPSFAGSVQDPSYALQEPKTVAPGVVTKLTTDRDYEEQEPLRKKVDVCAASYDFLTSKISGPQSSTESCLSPPPTPGFGGPGILLGNSTGNDNVSSNDNADRAGCGSVENGDSFLDCPGEEGAPEGNLDDKDVGGNVEPLEKRTSFDDLPLEVRNIDDSSCGFFE